MAVKYNNNTFGKGPDFQAKQSTQKYVGSSEGAATLFEVYIHLLNLLLLSHCLFVPISGWIVCPTVIGPKGAKQAFPQGHSSYLLSLLRQDVTLCDVRQRRDCPAFLLYLKRAVNCFLLKKKH